MSRIAIPLAHPKWRRKLTGGTLRLKRPFGKTFGLSIICFALLLLAGEAIARTDQLQALLIPPNMGTRHYEFGPKLFQLKSIVKKEGAIDCIFLGNSMVNYAIDPEVFASAYKEATGEEIRCFNFAIDAIPASVAGVLAPILVEEFHPKVLIYGTSARDYSVPREDEETTVILDTDWIRYRLGNFNIRGLLLQYSYLYRYRYYFPRLSRLNFRDTLRSRAIYRVSESGFIPLTDEGIEIDNPPDPNDQSLKRGFDLLYDYTMQVDNLDGLTNIINLNGPDLQIIIVEMPVPDTFIYFFENRKVDYQLFIDQVNGQAQTGSVPFLETGDLALIPDNGWADYSHMNPIGARAFSQWLGQRVGETLKQSPIGDLPPNMEG
jgi:hypothetical protein